MDDRNAQVGWTEAQWNRVREAVLREWQRVRVRGSFLPTYTNLPPSSQVVPSETVQPDGSVNDSDTIRIVELSASISLSRQQVQEDDLSDALLLMRRAATALARAEDFVIFNGQESAKQRAAGSRSGLTAFDYSRFPNVDIDDGEPVSSAPVTSFLGDVNPGAGGLFFADASPLVFSKPKSSLVTDIATALLALQDDGYTNPNICVLGQGAFLAAQTPNAGSLVLPADRIEPMLGTKLIRASALDELQMGNRGILLSLAGDAMDLVIPVSATPTFTQVNDRGRYAFRVYERFALRVKDPSAVKAMTFALPKV